MNYKQISSRRAIAALFAPVTLSPGGTFCLCEHNPTSGQKLLLTGSINAGIGQVKETRGAGITGASCGMENRKCLTAWRFSFHADTSRLIARCIIATIRAVATLGIYTTGRRLTTWGIASGAGAIGTIRQPAAKAI